MKESSSPPRSARYYCTAGKGMEKFLAEEVQLKLLASDVDRISGKVFFTTSADIETVKSLKSAERLFLFLKKDPPLSETCESGHRFGGKVVGERHVWDEGLLVWRGLRGALQESELGAGGARPCRKKRRLEEEEEVESERCEKRSPSDRPGGVEGRKPFAAETAPPGAGDDTHCCRPPPVSFRVSCRSSGAVARAFSPQDLGRIIGKAISKQLGWKMNLRQPDLEVNVHLSDDHCVCGIPLTRLPLAQRSYIRTTGLRSTIAWAMASLANIKPGDMVLDPMCGVGTVLLEAAKECQNSFFLGMDNDKSQLAKASENVKFAELGGRVEVMNSSVTEIPMPPCSVDAVVCDVPFGRKFGSKPDAAESLPVIVKEMERVLREEGVLVLLLSPQLSAVLGRSHDGARLPPSLEHHSTHRVSLGASDALIRVYRKVSVRGLERQPGSPTGGRLSPAAR